MSRDRRARGERSNALWGTGTRGGDGRSRRAMMTTAISALALALPLGAAADDGFGVAPTLAPPTALVSEGLRQAALAHPSSTFHVIVVGQPGFDAGDIKNDLMKDARGNQFGRVRREFKKALEGLAADMTGAQILQLADRRGIKSITPDTPVKRLSTAPAPASWREAVNLTGLSDSTSAANPVAIAVVDTGIDKDRKADFGGRVVQSQEFASLAPTRGSGTDYSGHGTLVAGIAAGASASRPGAAPNANIVSLRVMNEEGRAITSDVIAAVDWIFENRRSLNIRVVNFSLHSPYPNYAFHDPLNEAVRRLWLSGTVVVAAAGNTGAQRMLHAPASDPFVITVGALDTSGTPDPSDDVNAPWSGYGYTAEGFAKPELAAPGRYMVGPISAGSTLARDFADRIVAPGYMWMSGTSFAAPVVAGAAARIIARHPDWTPDQVKGALMLSARPLSGAVPMSAGVGEIDVAAAASATSTPNPNAALNQFVVSDRRVPGGRVFDTEAWSLAAWSSAAWSSAAWSSAAWSSAAWSSAAWSSAAWADAAWSSAAWADAAWANTGWEDAAWSSAAWAEAAWSHASSEE